MSAKLDRQMLIKNILNTRIVSSQEVLLKLLQAEEINVTQATLSRDFAELGVIRSFSEHGIQYVMDSYKSGEQISKLIGFEILSVEHNESLIVIRTLAGRAQGVAHFIDRLNKKEIIGTVAGDDTVIVIPSSQKKINMILEFINNLMKNNLQKI